MEYSSACLQQNLPSENSAAARKIALSDSLRHRVFTWFDLTIIKHIVDDYGVSMQGIRKGDKVCGPPDLICSL